MIFVFEEGMQDLLKQALTPSFDEDASILAKASSIVRRDIFQAPGFKFDGSFPSGCQQDFLPTSLKMLVSMLLNGADLQQQHSQESQACLTISQIIFFNYKQRTERTKTVGKSRHSLQYETPFPLYLGLKVHTQFDQSH